MSNQLSGFFVAFQTNTGKATQNVDSVSVRRCLAGLADSVFCEPQG
nr:MAG TPA: hypothetical protein [Caudoviricetes sp.]